MLRRANHLKRFTLGARDGEIGKVSDFYFDDEKWAIRYLVADTRKWVPGRKVLISPFALLKADEEKGVIGVDLTRDQIRNSPPIDTEKPVSQQYEEQYLRYYNWPAYWEGPWLWGMTAYPSGVAPVSAPLGPPEPIRKRPPGDPHLRSIDEVTNYHVNARDGEVGRLEDMILDDEDWAIRYIVVNSGNWLSKQLVLLSPLWITDVLWSQSRFDVDLDAATVKGAPAFNETAQLTREYETKVFDYFKREGYWTRPRRQAA